MFFEEVRKPEGTESIARFLGLEAEHADAMVLHACHMYAVLRGVEIRHRQTWRQSKYAEQTDNLIWNGHRAAAIHHVKVVKLEYKAIARRRVSVLDGAESGG